MDLKETENEDVDWLHLVLNRIQWQHLVKMMSLQVQQKVVNFFTS
jgi:hypothetical protein